MNIDLVPVGEIDPDILQELKGGLNTVLGCAVQIGDPLCIPGQAFDAARNQYLSDALLDWLRQHKNKTTHLLGITELNIYTPGLNFLFGQADVDALKEGVHELGHTMGLEHCRDGSCVMHYSNSLIDTDVKNCHFCSRCRPRLIA
jgi:archaemetzincin